MKIERLNQEEKFGDLMPGDTFLNNERPFMKIAQVMEYPQTKGSVIKNAISLDRLTNLMYYNDNSLVIPIMFKLVEISDCGCE